MSLTDQDRDWVKAMIERATIETLNSGKNFARGMVESHTKACPNVAKLKWILIGLGIGLGSQVPMLAQNLYRAFS